MTEKVRKRYPDWRGRSSMRRRVRCCLTLGRRFGSDGELVTRAMREMTGDTSVGRAEALRRAILAMIDKGKPLEAHPAFWAPFIVVGEGAR